MDGAAPGLTWLPVQFPGRLRVNAYALRDGEAWIGIDTGLPAHWDAIRDGLAPSLPGTTRRLLLNTRREQDGMANLPAMLGAFGITEAPYVGVLNPLELTGVGGAIPTSRLAVDEVLAVGRLRINTALVAALNQPAVGERLADLGTTPNRMTPADYTALVRSEGQRWAAIVREANITAD